MQRFVFGKAGHRLTDHLGGRLLVKAQPLFVAAQHFDVQKAFGMDAAVGDQAGEVVEAVFGHEGKAEAGDEQMVNLAVRGERAVAGDDVVPVFQGVGAQRGQKQRGGRAPIVRDKADVAAQRVGRLGKAGHALRVDGAQKPDAFLALAGMAAAARKVLAGIVAGVGGELFERQAAQSDAAGIV